jgi:geranyl-CoA carboxylase alpha subunit
LSTDPTITPLGDGRFLLVGGIRRRLAYAVVDGARAWVFIEGRIYTVGEAAGMTAARQSSHDDERTALSSPMPATVVDICVQPGDRVTRGDILVMLEAMKMELPVRAPRDAVVKSIAHRVGDLVQAGMPLLDLD